MSEGKILSKKEIDFTEILERFKKKTHDDTGAIGIFTGIVRKTGKKGGKVKNLKYECGEMAEEEIKEIAEDMEKNIGNIHEVAIYHIVDDLQPGDDIVYVFAEGTHREEVFETLSKTMSRLKKEVHIWKKEVTESNEYWMHEI